MQVKYIAGVSSGLLAACVSVTFSASPALAVDSTVTLTSAQTLALFGTPTVSYMQSTGGVLEFTTTSCEYFRTIELNGGSYYSPDGQVFEGREAIQYICHVSDYAQTGISVEWQLAVDLSALSYVDTAVLIQTTISDFDVTPYDTWQGWLHTSYGDFHALTKGLTGTDPNRYGYAALNSTKYIIYPAFYTGDSTAFSFGWLSTGAATTTYLGNYGTAFMLTIVCPKLADNWSVVGNSGAGQGDGSAPVGGDSGGSGSGGVSFDLSEVLDKLDTIIGLMQNDSSSSAANEVASSIDKLNSTMNPDYDSSKYSGAGAAQGAYLNAESQLLDNSTFGLDQLDSLDLTFNPTLTADKVSLLDVFFNNNMLVTMIGIVVAVGIISFVIFGKWV